MSFQQEVKDTSDYKPLRWWLAFIFSNRFILTQLLKRKVFMAAVPFISFKFPFFNVLFWCSSDYISLLEMHNLIFILKCPIPDVLTVELGTVPDRGTGKRGMTAQGQCKTLFLAAPSSIAVSHSLLPNCKRTAAPSSVVEYDLAAAMKWQDMPALLNWTRPMLSGTPSSSYLCKCYARQCNFNVIFSFHSKA